MATVNISDYDTIIFFTPVTIDKANHMITLVDFSSAVNYLDFTYDTLDDYPVLDISNDEPVI